MTASRTTVRKMDAELGRVKTTASARPPYLGIALAGGQAVFRGPQGYTPGMDPFDAAQQEAGGLQKAGLWREALELLDALEPPLPFRAQQMRGRSLWRLSRIPEAEEAFRAALAAAESAADREQQAAAYMSVGACLFEQSRFLDAAESLQRSLSFFDGRDCDGLANAFNWLAQTYHHMDLYDMAAAAFARGLEIAIAIGNKEIEAYLRSNSGLMQMAMGDNAAAEVSFRKALDLDREIGNPYGTADTLSNIGIALHASGRFEEAESWLRAGAVAHAELGAVPKEIMVRLYLADVLRETGRREEALDLLRTSIERVDDGLESFMRIQICALAFEQYMEMGMLVQASAVLDDLERFLARHEKSLSNQSRLHRYKAMMARVTGDAETVYANLLEALELQLEVST